MNDRLQSALRQLRLLGLAETIDVRLQEAAGHRRSHAEFQKLVLQDELLVREQRFVGRRLKSAAFREVKPLDEFDWSFNPPILRKRLFDLATCASSANPGTSCSSAFRAWGKATSSNPWGGPPAPSARPPAVRPEPHLSMTYVARWPTLPFRPACGSTPGSTS